MEHKIPCEIIRDLLPLYVDGLTSEATGREVQAHLKNCSGCSERYARMTHTITEEAQNQKDEDVKEINYLGKVKKRGFRKAVAGVFIGVALILAAIALKLFVLGYPVNTYAVTNTEIRENHLTVAGMFYDSSSVYKKYRLVSQEDGSSKLVIYGCLPTPWNRDGSFALDINMADVENQLNINGMTVKKDGTVISKLANDLYAAKNPYVGDMSANGKLAMILGIAANLGNFDNELQTLQTPYDWTLNFYNVTDPEMFEAQMKGYACVLIALIDNLDEVSWTYTADADDGSAMAEDGPTATDEGLAADNQAAGNGRVTSEECSQWVGEDIKGFRVSPEDVQRLLDKLVQIQFRR